MNKDQIHKNMMFLFTRGSQAYGTNNAQSDEDIGGICLPTREVILGVDNFEQDDNWVDDNGDKVDTSIYNFNKAMDLFCENNPNMLDYLYAPERCIKFETDEWEKVRDIREDFMCIKSKWTYQGYAVSQLNRIKTHRGYLLNPIEQPTRESFGLPEKSIFPQTQIGVLAKISSEWVPSGEQDAFFAEVSRLMDAEGSLIFKKYIDPQFYPIAIEDFKKRQTEFLRMISSVGQHFLKDEFMDAAHNELRYMAAAKNWEAFSRWKKNRNPARQALEAKSGYDTKHAMHLIRLLTMGNEILEGKGVNVDRTGIDRDHLMDIRNGVFTFDEIESQATILNARADENYKTTKLAKKPNLEKINALRMDIIERHLWDIKNAKDSNND
jgi:predicted nucleotidyltransferase